MFGDWFARWFASWFGSEDEPGPESPAGGGAVIDGAMDRRAMDEVVLRRRRKRIMDIVTWAAGSGAIR